MTRIVCPHCHVPLATTELERVLIDGRRGLLCPECSGLVGLEPATRDNQSLSFEGHHTVTAYA